jgi:SAM-dependent methyltransferase
MKRESIKLNLGCGDRHIPGFLNVDKSPPCDQVVDLSVAWPWGDETVDEIVAYDIIEHLPDKIHTMNEMWRVLKRGGVADIIVPSTAGPGAFQDPTHVSFWNERSFMYFENGNIYRERFAKSYGIKAGFAIEMLQVTNTVDGPKVHVLLRKV